MFFFNLSKNISSIVIIYIRNYLYFKKFLPSHSLHTPEFFGLKKAMQIQGAQLITQDVPEKKSR